MTIYDEKPRDFGSITELAEDFDVEAKAAQGRDGRGELPGSVWATYSAFANTAGGWIVLGAEEDAEHRLVAVGIADARRVVKSFWDGVNDRRKVSANVLEHDDVRIMDEGGRQVVVIRVPIAARQQRPVFVGGDPFSGTYKRNFEGDYRCSEDEVRRMIAESMAGHRDTAVLEDITLDDLEMDTVRAYRGMVSARMPDHPFVQGDEVHLLKGLGAVAVDRRSGAVQVTAGGLLLFGKWNSLLVAFPRLFFDYRERSNVPGAPRWDDRVFSDGTWSGNVFDFYRKVYPRLVGELKVPFQLDEQGRRIDETPVHEALREALANTLSHADYQAPTNVVILKEPGRFMFINPGRLRLPLAKVLEGGVSDPRNEIIHRAFILLGVAERAGSGMPLIFQASFVCKKSALTPETDLDLLVRVVPGDDAEGG